MEFRLSRVKGSPVSNEQLLVDLRRVADEVGHAKVTQEIYARLGKYDCTTPLRRFGTWNKALKAAGLEISNEVFISDGVLFENLLRLWQHFGRQPRRQELAKSPSTISQSPYLRRFKTWTGALEAFVSYVNSSGKDLVDNPANAPAAGTIKKSSREPSLRLRLKGATAGEDESGLLQRIEAIAS